MYSILLAISLASEPLPKQEWFRYEARRQRDYAWMRNDIRRDRKDPWFHYELRRDR